MTLTITIGRDSLAKPGLVITGARAASPSGLWVPQGGYQEPTFEPRLTYAPDSAYVGGSQLLAAVLGQGTLPLAVRAARATEAAVATLKVELEEALAQFTYPVTVELDGVTQTWEADYTWPAWAPREPWMRAQHGERATLAIPVAPPGA